MADSVASRRFRQVLRTWRLFERRKEVQVMRRLFRGVVASLAAVLMLLGPSIVVASDDSWPRRVLITNDNGIDDVATLTLAREFARVANVVVVAPSEDRSGTSNLMTFTRTGRFLAARRDVYEGVRAWALDGYPADCVVFAVAGPMAGAPPDLVVSGINGGANTSDAWFGSGTIGAVRTAAFLGIPAVAVSGVDDEDPDAMAAVAEWVVRLARSGIMEQVPPPSYLTISLPVGSPSEILGVEIVDRARGIVGGTAQLDSVATQATPGKEVWSISVEPRGVPAADSDVAAVERGYIAVVPMRVGDADPEVLDRLRANDDLLPTWQPGSREE
jgi:5'-nucleotidase